MLSQNLRLWTRYSEAEANLDSTERRGSLVTYVVFIETVVLLVEHTLY